MSPWLSAVSARWLIACAACWGTTPFPRALSACDRESPGVSVTCPAGRPIIHSTNRGERTSPPRWPVSVGGGASRPVTSSHRWIAGAYSSQGERSGVRRLSVGSCRRPRALPGRSRRMRRVSAASGRHARTKTRSLRCGAPTSEARRDSHAASYPRPARSPTTRPRARRTGRSAPPSQTSRTGFQTAIGGR